MSKLFAKNFIIGLTFMLIVAAVGAAVMALLSLLAKLMTMNFNAIGSYIAGGIIGLVCCLIFKRLFIQNNAYFMPQDLEGNNNKFWKQCIRKKKFIKRNAAIVAYIPSFIIGVGIIILAILLYPTLQSAREAQSYMGYSVLCGAIGATAVSWILYGIMGIKSLHVCKKCGSVNAFIYDEYLDFESTSGLTGGGMSYSYGAATGGVKYYGGGYNTTKIAKSGNRISRHCACCEEKSTFTEVAEKSGILQ
ncbi:MAG: hypothetical protein J1F36_00710 [Clostridiales bacterium]|nr:hypothetical protein [Clostridiales bacterium]